MNDNFKEVVKDAAVVGGTALAVEGLAYYSAKACGSNQATLGVLSVNAVLLYITFKVGASSLLLVPGLFLPIIAAFFFAPIAFWCLFIGVIVTSASDSSLAFYYFVIGYALVALYDSATSSYFFKNAARQWLLATVQVACMYAAWNRDEILKFVGMAS